MRVVYHGVIEGREAFFDRLSQKNGWEPVFFGAYEASRSWAATSYPNAVFHDDMAMRKARFDYSRLGPPVPVDAEILAVLAKYEFIFLRQIEDTTGWNFSLDERKEHYYEMLTYWNTVILRLKPGLFVSWNWPHTTSAYALYILCKHFYSIDVLFLDPMPLMGGDSYIVGHELEDLSAPFKKLYGSDMPLQSSDRVKAYLALIRKKEWGFSGHNQDSVDRFNKQKSFQWKDFLRGMFYFVQGKAFRESWVAFKKNRVPFDDAGSRLNHWEYFWFRDQLRRNDMKLKRIYDSFCVSPDYGRKYILFAASLQPEAPSDIGGGVYADLYLPLSILSAAIPRDWVIYFKEHPAIFWPTMKGSLRRDRHYYKRIRALGNLEMVPSDTDTFQLIDRSQAVATVAGSASWEAVVRGRPGMFFGNVWYQGCQSLYRIHTLQDCKDAIVSIINGQLPDSADVERYLSVIDKVALKNLIHLNFGERRGYHIYTTEELEKIAHAFVEAHISFYLKDKN